MHRAHRPHRQPRLSAGLALAALLVPGCATGGSADPDRGERDADSAVTVLVENRNWQDATIYVTGGSQRLRLGLVTSMASRRFRIPSDQVHPGGLELVAELVGSTDRKGTGLLVTSAGDRIYWTLQTQLDVSTVHVQ